MIRAFIDRVRQSFALSTDDRRAGNGWSGDDDLCFAARTDAAASDNSAAGRALPALRTLDSPGTA